MIDLKMKMPCHHPWLHRFAVLTACVALLPILVGALVTTKDAGMAFRDWPSSDGHNMLLYPWFQSAGAKFLEHGHRLAGILIGLFSIALAGLAFAKETRLWVKLLALAVLAGVVVQGLLGGQRVLLDARGLAFVHGSFAALVFALIAVVAAVTSRGWFAVGQASRPDVVSTQPQAVRLESLTYGRLRTLSLVTCMAIFAQYVLGGLLRHRGMVLYEHLGFAFLVTGLAAFLVATVLVSGAAWLRWPAAILGLLVMMQLVLGAGAWVTKFGFDAYVAVYGSTLQVWMRTAHVLTGMLLFMTSVVLALRVWRLDAVRRSERHTPAAALPREQPLGLAGGPR